MLIYFYFGELEWINENEFDYNNFERENNYIKIKKESINEKNDIPNVLLGFYEKIRTLSFEERPYYENYMDNFREEILKLVNL